MRKRQEEILQNRTDGNHERHNHCLLPNRQHPNLVIGRRDKHHEQEVHEAMLS